MNLCTGKLILKLFAWIGEWHQILSEKTFEHGGFKIPSAKPTDVMPLHKMVGLESAEVWANGSVLMECPAVCVYVQVLLYMYLFGYISEGNVILKTVSENG